MKFPIILRRVSGQSMAPALKENQLVVGLRHLAVGLGDIIIFEHKGLDKIKRIKDIDAHGQVDVAGDNKSYSTDSKDFGAIDKKTVIAKVIFPRG